MRRSSIAGFATIAVYGVGTIASLALFPSGFDVTKSYLSDLGSATLNPRGAILYRLGIALAGVTLVPFFVGLGAWAPAVAWRARALLATRAIGLFEAAALVLIGVFPEGHAHIVWSNAQFFANLLVLALGTAALGGHPRFSRGATGLGVVAVALQLAALAFIVAGHGSPLVEWLTVGTTLAFVGVVAARGARA